MHMVLKTLFAGLVLTLAALPVSAVTLDAESRAPTGDADFDAGVSAFAEDDWQGVIDNMRRVVERRPWHDEAHTLLGFAWRKLGDYDRSLAAYDKALELNPHNRGALEYLGEAYLELDRPDQARAMLERLETACRRARGEEWRADCEEWDDLKAAYDAHASGSDRAATQ